MRTVVAIRPILSALRRHKSGAMLISLQIALTLAIVCNALFIIAARVERVGRPSGLIETDLFRINTVRAGLPTDGDAAKARLDADVRADLAALRGLPEVQDAYETSSLPLSGHSWTGDVQLSPDKPGVHTAFYAGDEHSMATLGFRLAAGRNFLPGEVKALSPREPMTPAVIMISKPIADRLFPAGDALGKAVYVATDSPATIVGIVERLQSPSVDAWAKSFSWSTTIVPARFADTMRVYAIRARPGRMDAAMKASVEALYAQDNLRVIPDEDGVQAFAQTRADAYRSDRGMAILMVAVCLILLVVTAAGVVGLSSFWVGQRRKQIGIRRALGATRHDILGYFLTENALITVGGLAVGIVLAFGLNAWLMVQFELSRLSMTYVVVGVVALLALGQAAAFAPALRASRIPPVEATRTV